MVYASASLQLPSKMARALLLVVELNGPTMMARISVLRALNRHVRVFNPDRKDTLGEAQAEEGPMTTRSVLARDRNA